MKVQIQYSDDKGVNFNIETERDLWDLKRFIKCTGWGMESMKVNDRQYNDIKSKKYIYQVLGWAYNRYNK